jgi:DUF4097 and DUF4098 domain-containing protein YvlB
MTTNGKRLLSIPLLAGFTLMLAACGDLEGFHRETEPFHYSHALDPGGHMSLETGNGSIEISGWDRNELEISGEKFAPSKDGLSRVKVQIQVDGGNVSIRTVRPTGMSTGSYGAEYHIHVPKSISLDPVETTNGGIDIADLTGPGHVKSTNGHIVLSRVDGDYRAETTNGAIDLRELNGVVRAHTTNGHIKGDLNSGAVTADTTNGSVELKIEKPQAGEAMRLGSTNGGIRLELAEFNNNAVRAQTTNGGITLRIPEQTSAALRAENTTSSIQSDLKLSQTEDQSKHHLFGQLGSGGPLIELKTSTGGIHIERY